MSSWNLEGLYVRGTYLAEFPVYGRVENSRVAYGGSVKHTVVLETPINVYGALRDRVIIDHETVQRVQSNPDVFSPFQTINS